MKYFPFTFLFFLACCSYLPEMAQTIDDIETSDTVSVIIDKEAFKKDTDVRVNIDILNKDPIAPKPLY